MTKPARCPSLADLLDGDPAYADHVLTCPRCRALLRAAEVAHRVPGTSSEHATSSRAPTLGGRRRGKLQAGQICTVAFADLDEYLVSVVIETDGADARVAPITDEIDMASDADLFLDASVLGYEAMAQVAIAGDVLVEQVHDVLAEVGADLVASLVHLLVVADRTTTAELTGLATGRAISGEDDPRLLFREEEREQAASFYLPAAMLAEADTLGHLIRARRSEFNLSLDDADALLGGTGRTARLEISAVDLHAEIPAPALFALLRDLDVGLHEGTARLVGQAVAAGATVASPSQPATGLRAINRRPATGGTLGNEPRKRAQRYIDALWNAAPPAA
jgi:hypothetical protein